MSEKAYTLHTDLYTDLYTDLHTRTSLTERIWCSKRNLQKAVYFSTETAMWEASQLAPRNNIQEALYLSSQK